MQEMQFYSKRAYDMIGQYENWCNLLDMANAVKYGFSQYRLAKPGVPIDIVEAETRVKSVDREWSEEHYTRGSSSEKSCPEFSNLSMESKCYLHSILISSDELQNTDEWGFVV